MSIKKLQNNYTTPEQSKRLLELGVPADSADLYSSLGFENLIWIRNTNNELSEDFFDALINEKSAHIPIWSVGRLMEITFKCDKLKINIKYGDLAPWKSTIIESMIDILEYAIKLNDIDFSKLEE